MGYGAPRTQNNYYQPGYQQQFPGYMPPSIGQVTSQISRSYNEPFD